jgi:hypothetical protein
MFALIDSNPMAVKQNDDTGRRPLDYPLANRFSNTVIRVLTELTNKSDYELVNRINIPIEVMVNGVGNRRRQGIYHWLLLNTPTKQMDGLYRQEIYDQKPDIEEDKVS